MRSLRLGWYWPGIVFLCGALLGCPWPAPGPGVGGPDLALHPSALDFGAHSVLESFTVRNAGSGTKERSVEVSVPWLTADVTTGTTTTETDRVRLSADRSGLAFGDHTATVTVSTSVGGTQVIPVALEVAGTADVSVNPRTLTFAGSTSEGTFTISNSGNDTLTWNLSVLDPEDPSSTIDIPPYLTIEPTTGGIPPDQSSAVQIAFDPEQFEGETTALGLAVETNAGPALVTIHFVAAESQAQIGVDPAVLEFGRDANVLTLNVFNDGPASSVLDFSASSDRPELLSLNPAQGTSTGTTDPNQRDRVPVTVVVNRAELEGATDGATITVSADGVESVEVPVTVERAPLTLEGAQNRTRPPFILRFIFTIRDSLGEAIDTTDPNVLAELQNAFTIQENDEFLDVAETNTFVTRAENLRVNLGLLLDYTGSMYEAGNGDGSAIAQMETGAKGFVQDIPESYRLAVMEYHDRQQTSRLVHGFSRERDSILSAIDSFSLFPGEHGASEVFDAVADACTRIANEDLNVMPFYDADVRGLVFISDGRDTSSFNSADDAIDIARELRVRLYPIGFGENVNEGALIRMATETGGHYYSANTSADLRNLLANETQSGEDAPGVIVKDLERQIVLTYITLFQSGDNSYLITANYQGNQGSFEEDAVVAVNGDVRAGQMALVTDGLPPEGPARVYVRTDYVPRAVTQIRFRVITDQAVNVELTPGGLAEDWILLDQGGGVYLAITNETSPLPYGAFGDLFRLTFPNPGDMPFEVGFRVGNTLYQDPPTRQFFQYPYRIEVGDEAAVASVAPLLIEDGFDPDAPFAFDRDEDGVLDFDDLYPEDELRSK